MRWSSEREARKLPIEITAQPEERILKEPFFTSNPSISVFRYSLVQVFCLLYQFFIGSQC